MPGGNAEEHGLRRHLGGGSAFGPGRFSRGPTGLLQRLGADILEQQAEGWVSVGKYPTSLPGWYVPTKLFRSPFHPEALFLIGRDSESTKGAVYATRNAGATWQEVNFGTYTTVPRDILEPDAQTIWITFQHPGVLESTDGGQSWSRIESLPRNTSRLLQTTEGQLFVGANGGVFLQRSAVLGLPGPGLLYWGLVLVGAFFLPGRRIHERKAAR